MRKQVSKNAYAIWVDHKNAIIACVNSEGHYTTETLKSDIVSPERFKGEKTKKTGALGATIDHQQKTQNREHEMTHHFMKEILAKVSRPSVIIILGPADAKYELHRQLDKTKSLKPEFVEIKTADKMKLTEIKAALALRLQKGIPM